MRESSSDATYDLDLQQLKSIMQQPFAPHPEAKVRGGLRAAHINTVLRMLPQLGEREDSLIGGKAPAFHSVVFHLAGGANAGLRPPPRKGESEALSKSSNFLTAAEKACGTKTWGARMSVIKTEMTQRRRGTDDNTRTADN